jgi:hypothetical protein
VAFHIIIKFVHKPLFYGASVSLNRIVAAGHAGEAGKGTGIPGSEPDSCMVRGRLIGDVEAGTGRAYIGTAATILAASGKELPDLLVDSAFLQSLDGLVNMDLAVESAAGFEEGLVSGLAVLLCGFTEELLPLAEDLFAQSPADLDQIVVAEIGELQICTVFHIRAALGGITEAVREGVVAVKADQQGGLPASPIEWIFGISQENNIHI